jgi:hypothetical protein
MSIRMFRFICLTAVAALAVSVGTAQAGFNSFVIRHSTANPLNAPGILPNNAYVPGATEFVIAEGGQKAGLGSSDIDGSKLDDITKLAIIRHDDETRFTAGSGPAVAPYFNIWITDGTNYAVVANEPSNPDFQALYNNGYDLDWSDISGKVAKIYENNDKTWLPNNGVGLTFADLANFTIKAPTAGELTTGWAGLGTGAPRELGTNQAYGVNWIFGDTLSNYVSAPSNEGFVVSGAQVQIPEPATLALAGVAGLGMFAASRRRRNS